MSQATHSIKINRSSLHRSEMDANVIAPAGPLAQGREFVWTTADFARVQGLIYKRAGISLHDGKHAMVYSRVSRRLREANGNHTTKNNLRRIFVTMFKWSRDRGYLAPDKKTAPERALERPQVDIGVAHDVGHGDFAARGIGRADDGPALDRGRAGGDRRHRAGLGAEFEAPVVDEVRGGDRGLRGSRPTWRC